MRYFERTVLQKSFKIIALNRCDTCHFELFRKTRVKLIIQIGTVRLGTDQQGWPGPFLTSEKHPTTAQFTAESSCSKQ